MRPSVALLAAFAWQAFGQTPTATTLIASPNPSHYGQPVTLTASVTAGATGKVTFYDDATVLGAATLSGTQASLTTILLPSGAGKLRAYYQGDGTFAPSNSGVARQTVVAGKSAALHPPPTPGTLVASDFNGDGKVDLLAFESNAIFRRQPRARRFDHACLRHFLRCRLDRHPKRDS